MIRIPITVGIIGHLDAIITNEHTEVIEKLFNDISIQYPNSPVTLFSQLAKGTDTKIAKQFIEIKEKENRDYSLVVPLPFNETEFKNEFKPNELEEFEELKSKAERCFEIENSEKFAKKELYRNGGKFVADSSIILISIWDNNENDKKGGTADIVKYKIEGSFKDDIEAHIFDLNGSLISLPCKRANSETELQEPLGQNHLEKLLEDNSIKKSLEKIEEFNKKLNKTKLETLTKSADFLYPKEKSLLKQNQTLKDYYTIIDTQAIQQQKKYNNLILGFFAIGFFILVSFEVYKHLGLNQSLFAVTVGLIAMAYLIFKFAHNWSNHKQFIEDRILAEALRIQFFWNVSDINKSVSKYILRIHKTEYNWVKHILLSIYGLTYNTVNTRDETINDVKKEWITDQNNYFTNNLIKLHNKKRYFDVFSKLFFVIALIALVGIFILHYKDHHHLWLHPLIVFDSVVFGLFALTKAYYEKKGYEQIRNQYSLMSSIYFETEKKMNDIENSNLSKENKEKQLDQLLYLAGKEALVENGNWYLIFKEKEPEVEIGG